MLATINSFLCIVILVGSLCNCILPEALKATTVCHDPDFQGYENEKKKLRSAFSCLSSISMHQREVSMSSLFLHSHYKGCLPPWELKRSKTGSLKERWEQFISLLLSLVKWTPIVHPAILRHWRVGGYHTTAHSHSHSHHKPLGGWSLCKFVVVNVKIEGLFAWFSIFANLPVWSLLVVFVKFYSDFSSIDVKSYCYSTRRTQIDCWTRCHFLLLIL